jgi:hypothetical protein
MVMHIRVTTSLANGPLLPSEYFPVRFLSRTCGLREGLRFMVLVFLVGHMNGAALFAAIGGIADTARTPQKRRE